MYHWKTLVTDRSHTVRFNVGYTLVIDAGVGVYGIEILWMLFREDLDDGG